MTRQRAQRVTHASTGPQVTAVTPHPSSAYFVTASMDKSWAFYDAATATCLSTVPIPRSIAFIRRWFGAVASLHP